MPLERVQDVATEVIKSRIGFLVSLLCLDRKDWIEGFPPDMSWSLCALPTMLSEDGKMLREL